MLAVLCVLTAAPASASAATAHVPGAPQTVEAARNANFALAVPVYGDSAWRISGVDPLRGRYRLHRVSLRTGRTTSVPITLEGAPTRSALVRTQVALGPGRLYVQQRWCSASDVDLCGEQNQTTYLQQAFDVRDGRRVPWAGGDDLTLNPLPAGYSGAYLSDRLRPPDLGRTVERLYDVETRAVLPFEIPNDGTLWIAAGDHVLIYRRDADGNPRHVTLVHAATGAVRYSVDLQRAARVAGGRLSADQPRVMPDGSLGLRFGRKPGARSVRPTTIDRDGRIVTVGPPLRDIVEVTTFVGGTRAIVAATADCRRVSDERGGVWVLNRDGARGRRLYRIPAATFWDGRTLVGGATVRTGIERLRLKNGKRPGCRA